jgi:hypothetical protein
MTSIASGAAVATRTALLSGQRRRAVKAAVGASAAILAGAPIVRTGQRHDGCTLKGECAFDLRGCAAVQLGKDPFAIMVTNLVQ